MYPEEPLEVDTVSFVCCIALVTRMVFGFLRKMKRKIIVSEGFVLVFPVAPEINGGS